MVYKFVTKISLCLLVVCIIWQLGAQQYRGGNQSKQLFDNAIRLYELDEPTPQSDSIALSQFLNAAWLAIQEKNYQRAAESQIKAGTINQTYKRFDAARERYYTALDINNRHLRNLTIDYEAWLYLGSAAYFTGSYDSASYYFEKSSAIDVAHPELPLPERGQLYNSLGAIYYESADYLQAKKYFEKALLFLKPSEFDYDESFIAIKSNAINCLHLLKEYNQAIEGYQQLRTYLNQHPQITSYNNLEEILLFKLGQTYFDQKKYDSTILCYQRIKPAETFFYTRMLNDLGNIYLHKKDLTKAENYFDSAIAINNRITKQGKSKYQAMSYYYRGILAQKQGLTDEALLWCNEALQKVHFSFKWQKPEDLPEDITNTVSPITLFEILRTKAKILFAEWRHMRNHSKLQFAVATFSRAVETANSIKKNFDNDESRLFFNENYRSIFYEAAEAAYELYQEKNTTENASYLFSFIENYKGNILLHNLQDVAIKNNTNIPNDLLQKEREIKKLIAFYTTKINNNENKTEDTTLQNKLLEKQVELSRLQKTFAREEKYSLYKNASTSFNKSSIHEVQKWLDGNSMLLSYMMADSMVYAIAISADDCKIFTARTDKKLLTELEVFTQNLYQHHEGNRYGGAASGSYLYQQLVAPAGNIAANNKQWIILPDGFINYIPFDAINTNNNQPAYLAQQKIISYHYSFALLSASGTATTQVAEMRLGMAPFSEADSHTLAVHLPALSASLKEINVAGSQLFNHRSATKENFEALAPKSTVIHLATHASAGNDSSGQWIQFYPSQNGDTNGKLYLHDIYNMNLSQTRLILLSACETGAGKAYSGEGLQSFSRGFLYAGCKAVVSTLWKTADEVSYYLMQRMHHHMAAGHHAAKALYLAKIDLLNDDSINPQYKTPNYWSNFIYIGAAPHQKRSIGWMWFALLCVMAAGVAAMLYNKKKSG